MKYLISYWGTSSEGYPEWQPVIKNTLEDTIRWLNIYKNCRGFAEAKVYQLGESIPADVILKEMSDYEQRT